MNKIYPKNVKELKELFDKSETIEELFLFQALATNYFDSKTEKSNDLINAEDDFCIYVIIKIFEKKKFTEALGKILEQYKYFTKKYLELKEPKNFWELFNEMEIKNKKIIFIHLTVSLSILSNILHRLDTDRAIYISKILGMFIRKIRDNFSYKYSSSEISTVLLSCFNKNCLVSIRIPFSINLTNLFKIQKFSNRLISLSIKFAFKNSLLSNRFKNIEKDILSGKFGYPHIYDLNNFIKSEKGWEKKYIEDLNSSLENTDQLNYFIKNLINDNEKNAFNLIEISLKSFKSIEKINENVINITNDADKIITELQEYGKKNFKAFSSNVVEGNTEWSNKIYINCCKFLGAIKSLSGYTDKGWGMDVILKELIEWVLSIHKILNKYDIEDDWEKISRYLNQETNTIEWKSTFLTPIEKIDKSSDYSKVSHDIFYKIIKTVLGMMNSDGGVIIVGLVEKPEEIIDIEVKKNLLLKNGKYFLDISKELLKNEIDLDGIKRKIQDLLRKEVFLSLDNFNNLWSIEPIYIKSSEEEKEITIYKIEIKKSNEYIFSAKTLTETNPEIGDENIWISLLKRADARTIRVDPRHKLDTIKNP